MSNDNSAFLQRFLKRESAGGILLFCTALLAMLMANSPLAHIYSLFIETPVVIRIGALVIDKPLLLCVNDCTARSERRWWHGRAGCHLSLFQRSAPRDRERLGHTGGHGYYLRARCAQSVGVTGSGQSQDLPDLTGHLR